MKVIYTNGDTKHSKWEKFLCWLYLKREDGYQLREATESRYGTAGQLCVLWLFLPVIFIQEKYREDKGLLAHEVCHYEQWKKNWLCHTIWYATDCAYRLGCELEAYTEQLVVNGSRQHMELYAKFIHSNYGFNVDLEVIEYMLAVRYSKCLTQLDLS